MRAGGSGQCLLDARQAPVAHPRFGSPRRLPAGAKKHSRRSRLPRRLEGAVLTVSRGRLNPLLPLQWLGKRAEGDGWERRRGQPARRRRGLDWADPARALPGRCASPPPPPTVYLLVPS